MDITVSVQDYYGKKLQKSDDLLSNAACCKHIKIPKHVEDALIHIHDEVVSRYYGCGLVIPSCLENTHVLDLGCGAGRDCFLLSALVGAEGLVTGLDMTAEQLEVANRYVEYHREKLFYPKANTVFLCGFIEDLLNAGVPGNSQDVIVSNCVVNLSSDKKAVFSETFKVLKDGGEVYFSDMYSDQEASSQMRNDPVIWGEGFGGALPWWQLHSLAKTVGFSTPRLVTASPITVNHPKLEALLGGAKFISATYRMFKLTGSPSGASCGVVYEGGVLHYEDELDFDCDHTFKVNEQTDVDCELGAILRQSRYAPYFTFNPNKTSDSNIEAQEKSKEPLNPYCWLQNENKKD